MSQGTPFKASKVSHVILHVRDMKRAAAFYRDALGASVRMESPDWTELATQGTTVALHATSAGSAPSGPNVPVVVFEADDVRAAHATLRDRRVEISDLKKVWESPEVVGLSGDFKDPDGNTLSIHGTVPAAEWNGR